MGEILSDEWKKRWRAPSEKIRTASEIPIEVDLTDEDAVPVYMKISEKVLHLRRLGMAYAGIAATRVEHHADFTVGKEDPNHSSGSCRLRNSLGVRINVRPMQRR